MLDKLTRKPRKDLGERLEECAPLGDGVRDARNRDLHPTVVVSKHALIRIAPRLHGAAAPRLTRSPVPARNPGLAVTREVPLDGGHDCFPLIIGKRRAHARASTSDARDVSAGDG